MVAAYAVILFHVVGRAVRPHTEAGAPACKKQAAQLCEWRVIPPSIYIHIQPPTLNHSVWADVMLIRLKPAQTDCKLLTAAKHLQVV